MHYSSQSNGYKNYPYIPPSDPITSLNPMTSLNSMGTIKRTPSLNTNYQNYDPPQRTEEFFNSHTTLIPTYTSECFQRMYQAPTTRSELTDSSWVFDDMAPPANYQSTGSSLSSGYMPTNPVKRSTVSDTRLATASTMREQLLTDILRDIGDINEEISSMEGQLSRSRQFPSGFSPLEGRDLKLRQRDFNQTRSLPEPDTTHNDEKITTDWD